MYDGISQVTCHALKSRKRNELAVALIPLAEVALVGVRTLALVVSMAAGAA